MAKQEAGKGEACCWCLSHCCLLYGVFGVVLMLWFAYLIHTDSLTFKLAKMKNSDGVNPDDDWKNSEKVTTCITGAVLYAITFGVSVCEQKGVL